MTLFCYLYIHLMVISTGEWLRIGEQCQMDVESIPVARLQARLWSPPASIEQKKILDVFAVLFDEKWICGILAKIWNAVCPPVVSSPSILTADVWPKFIDELDRMTNDLVTLNITCSNAANLLHSQLAIEELKLLEQVLYNSHLFTPPRHFSPCKVRDKLLLFETVLEVQEGARNFLELKASIGFTGDFTAVENIARVSKTTVNCNHMKTCTSHFALLCIYLLQSAEEFSVLPLRSLDADGTLKEVVDFLMNLHHGRRFSSLKDCLCGLQKSSELVKWLRDDVQGKRASSTHAFVCY